MTEIEQLYAIFLIGFLGSGHCMSMCGGLSTAFALQLPPNVKRWQLVLLLNSGRVTSYVLIGALLGGLGQFGLSLDQTKMLQYVLLILANLLLFLLGLNLLGLTAPITYIEKMGRPVWKYLNKFLQKLLPVRSAKGSFLVGMFWGWLPCGMVYTASVYALSSGSLVFGALCMLAFALGTLPSLLSAGLLATQVQKLLALRALRVIAGLFLIYLAYKGVSHLSHMLHLSHSMA